jgi:hypothetical protein
MNDAGRIRAELDRRLEPARAQLQRQRVALARSEGFAQGVELMPRLALGLVLAWFGLRALGGAPIVPAWTLPAMLLLVPPAAALALARRERRSRVAPYDAAVEYDAAARTQDRVSAAYDLAAHRSADPREHAFADAAVADGLEHAQRNLLDVVGAPPPPARARVAPALLALLIAALPLGFLLLETTPPAPPPPPPPVQSARVPPPPADERPAPPAPDQPATPPRETAAAARSTEGSAQSGSAPGERGVPLPGEAQAGQRGTATPGAGSGGQGQASRSQAPAEPAPAPAATKQAPKPRLATETPRELGSENAAAPGGPARATGRMAPVTNQRPGLDRGPERDDSPPSEDEPIEDETEESEQRGGVMPMGRDRQQPPTRELSISGEGPPDDGRGGPTPPKKSRGTAALVLGLRLPDQIRGRPNPGTAKTSLAPRPPQAEPGPTHPPSPGAAGPAAPQSLEVHGDLDRLVLRYHELLRQPQR